MCDIKRELLSLKMLKESVNVNNNEASEFLDTTSNMDMHSLKDYLFVALLQIDKLREDNRELKLNLDSSLVEDSSEGYKQLILKNQILDLTDQLQSKKKLSKIEERYEKLHKKEVLAAKKPITDDIYRELHAKGLSCKEISEEINSMGLTKIKYNKDGTVKSITPVKITANGVRENLIGLGLYNVKKHNK